MGELLVDPRPDDEIMNDTLLDPRMDPIKYRILKIKNKKRSLYQSMDYSSNTS